MTHENVDRAEVAKFDALAARWWDPDGEFRPLHEINPLRLDWIRQYDPYPNLRPGAYPTMLVRTSFNDSQVMYWEPAKYVARLRTLKTDTHPLLLITNMGAGHHGASGRYEYLKEIAFRFAFIIDTIQNKEKPHEE